jgi:uncharacterized iron-regulated protein
MLVVAAIASGGAALAACAGGYQVVQPAPRGVAAAGLPFVVLDGRDGHELPAAEAWTRLRAARAVCAGEQHDSPHDHWVQLQIVDHLSKPELGAPLALGLEMVQQPFQGVIDDWRGERIDDATLRSRTGWDQRWGFDFALYRPMLVLARARGATLHALNAPSELVKRVAKVGVDGLAADERARLPQLELGDAQHRGWFDRIMGDSHAHGAPTHSHSHSHSHDADDDADDSDPADAPPAPPADAIHAHVAHPAMPSADFIYAAQVVWDESMADAAARAIAGGGHIIILAGNGHCHDSAIVRRLARRGVAPVVSVRPIIDDGDGNVAAALAEGINDFLIVMTPPPRPAERDAPSPPAP